MCLGSAILVDYAQKIIAKFCRPIISYSVIILIAGFGIVITSMLITLDVNSSYYKVYASIAQQIPSAANKLQTNVTIIGSHFWVWDSYWITQFVLDRPHELIDPHLDSKFKKQVKTNNVLFVDDPIFLKSISRKINSENLDKIREIHNRSVEIASFIDNVTTRTTDSYPYNALPIMISNEGHPTGNITIRKNY
jgi:hypothetical protein